MDILHDIDSKATKEAIKSEFRRYRTYQLTTPDDLLPTITPKYTLEMPAFTNEVNSKVESAAIKNLEYYIEAEKFFNRFNRGLYKLSRKERQLIFMAYLAESPFRDYEIYRELNVSERTFYRIKPKALYTLAFALGVVKYKEEAEVKN